MNFNKTERKLCQDIAKYWRKDIETGGWIIPKGYSPQPTILLSIDEKDGLHYGFMPSDGKGGEGIIRETDICVNYRLYKEEK